MIQEQDYIQRLEDEIKELNDSITWWNNRFKAKEKEIKKLRDTIRQIRVVLEDKYGYLSLSDYSMLIDLCKGDDKE